MDDYNNPALKGITPVSLGDGPKWVAGQPKESMFSLYSTSIAGVFGAIVHTTDVEGILALDCNITDFYAENKYPEFLYFNPFGEEKTVTHITGKSVDLFDIISKSYVVKAQSGKIALKIPAGSAVLIVELPAGTRLTTEGKKLKANGYVISYK
jgi:hypothetical protein